MWHWSSHVSSLSISSLGKHPMSSEVLSSSHIMSLWLKYNVYSELYKMVSFKGISKWLRTKKYSDVKNEHLISNKCTKYSIHFICKYFNITIIQWKKMRTEVNIIHRSFITVFSMIQIQHQIATTSQISLPSSCPQ